MGLQGGDVIKTINGTPYDLSNVYELIGASSSWKEGDAIRFIIQREDQEIIVEGKITTPMINKALITELQYFVEGPELRLRQSWLKGS